MAVIFLFIDGVGLGEEGPQNTFSRTSYGGFEEMAGGQPFLQNSSQVKYSDHLFKAVDATLGVEGLPQSGTGQTTLFTGKNAALKVGRHFGPFPHSEIKPFLKEQSMFHKAAEKGKRCTFMNAYPDIFFQRSEKRNRWSCTTLMSKSAGITLNTEEDLRQGKAITAELTQQEWRDKLGIDVPGITPEEAARRMLLAAGEYDLLLYEYYLTDKAGHSQSHRRAEEVISRFDAFLSALIREKDKEDILLLSSDHGNVEDLSTKTHTFNKVPLFVQGPAASAFREVESIQGITPAMLEIL